MEETDRQLGQRVAGRGLAVRRHPQDLAVDGVLVLGEVAVLRVASGRVQVAVRADLDAAAVVVLVLGDTGDRYLVAAERGAVVRHPDDAVVGGRGVHEVDVVVAVPVR
jgi:hypothetical protein